MKLKLLVLWGTAVLLSACALPSMEEPELPFSPVAIESNSEPTTGIVFVTSRHVEYDPSEIHQNWELYLIQPDGSGETRITNNEVVDASPSWSPDGRQLILRSREGDNSADIFIMNADGSNRRNIVQDSPSDFGLDEFNPSWSPDGEWVALYTDRSFKPGANGCALHRAAVMPITGGKENIRPLDAYLGNQESMSWSMDSKQIVLSSRCHEGPQMDLFLWEVATDEITQLTNDVHVDSSPEFSKDGRFLAYTSVRDGNPDVYIMNMESGELRNLTDHPAKDTHPTWSPDGTQLAFVSDRDGNEEIYVINVDGSNPQNISNHPARDFEPAWSPVP